MAGSQALENSIGRRMFTSFVVPLPCGSGWNKTQSPRGASSSSSVPRVCPAVGWTQHTCILREALSTGRRRPSVAVLLETIALEDFRDEMLIRSTYEQWPVHLVVRWPSHPHPLVPPTADKSASQWRSLVDSRLVATLSPQLDACGLFARPLCMDDPFVFLLWPQEAAWTRHAEIEVLLPLRRRVSRVLFLMLLEAHQSMWPQDGPPLRDLVPEVQLMRHLPDAAQRGSQASTWSRGCLSPPAGERLTFCL